MGGFDCRNHPLWSDTQFKNIYENKLPKELSWYHILRRAPEDSLLQYIIVQILAKKRKISFDAKVLSTSTIKAISGQLDQLEKELLQRDFGFITGSEGAHLQPYRRREKSEEIPINTVLNMPSTLPLHSGQKRIEKKKKKLEWHLSLREFIKNTKIFLLVTLVILLSIPCWFGPSNYIGECQNHAVVPTNSLSRIANEILKEIDSHPENLTPQKFNTSMFLDPLFREITKIEFKYLNVSFCCLNMFE